MAAKSMVRGIVTRVVQKALEVRGPEGVVEIVDAKGGGTPVEG